MYLQKLKLINFRSYENLELELSNGVNVFYGDNAHGKTNILEAIYLSCITKSYRATKDTECINLNKDFFRTNLEFVVDDNKSMLVEVFLDSNGKKQIKENGVKVGKYSDFLGKLPVVIFSPENMDIVKGAPKNRRKFLDILISQISKSYVVSLQEYNKLIQLKNSVLKKEKTDIDYNYLDILDEKIAEKIQYIASKRVEYVDKVDNFAKLVEQKLTSNKEQIEIKYVSEFCNLSIDKIREVLKKSREQDLLRKTSTKGIGHDDIDVIVNGLVVNQFGSQGQNRTALLSMKLAEFEILKAEKDTVPIVLLDDVFSELDKERINFLMDYVKDYQVVITTTEIDSIKDVNNKTIFKVKNSTVEKKIN